jgi:preprotein translocase subunit YajC
MFIIPAPGERVLLPSGCIAKVTKVLDDHMILLVEVGGEGGGKLKTERMVLARAVMRFGSGVQKTRLTHI